METIYEYVRGKGWEPICANYVTMACGTLCIVEQKTFARANERYFVYYRFRTIDEVKELLSAKEFLEGNIFATDRPKDEAYFHYVLTPVNV